MREKSSILILYPHDFSKSAMGIDTRYNELIKYFNNRGFDVDQVGLKNFVSKWENETGVKNSGIRNLYLYDHGRVDVSGNGYSLKTGKDFKEIPDYTDKGFKEYFIELVLKGGYKYILISYIYWAELINDKRLSGIRKVLDLSDFTTLILKGLWGDKIKFASFINEEIRRINLFDDVLAISADEMWLFSQFAKNPNYFYIPHFMEKGFQGAGEKTYDILFIGSDNEFNKEGIKWFFDNVYPSLDKSLKILIVGKITSCVDEYKNVEKISFAEDLNKVYSNSKILIAPMFGGTGLKIKVVEGLSYGLPVVTTSKGVVGFKNKNDNGCLITENPEGFKSIINKLLSDRDFYDKTSEKAKNYFLDNFDSRINYKKLDRIFLQEYFFKDQVRFGSTEIDSNYLKNNPDLLKKIGGSHKELMLMIFEKEFPYVSIKKIHEYIKTFKPEQLKNPKVLNRINLRLGNLNIQMNRVAGLAKGNFSISKKKCLDIGCGYGALVCAMLGNGAEKATGIDINEAVLEIAQKFCDSPDAVFRSFNIYNHDLEEKFDAIFCVNVFEHIPDVKIMVERIVNHLKEGKDPFVFLSVYNKNSMRNILREPHYNIPGLILLPYQKAKRVWERARGKLNNKAGYEVFHWYNYDEYEKLLSDTGMKIIPFNRMDLEGLYQKAEMITQLSDKYRREFSENMDKFDLDAGDKDDLDNSFQNYLEMLESDHHEVLKRKNQGFSRKIYLKYYAQPINFIMKFH